jgi:uracil-DNA glycosylase family 4
MASERSSGRAARIVSQKLEALASAGLTHLGKPRRRAPAAASGEPALSASVETPLFAHCDPAARGAPAQQASEGIRSGDSRAERETALRVIQSEVAKCTLCDDLARTRTQTVFGVGNPMPRLCFLGEAPGADEDRQGEPFVGRAGQLLTKIIEACGMRRQDVYILNVLKCRPPGNRTPLPHEVYNCRPFLDRQLDVLRPEFICCLGSVAAQTLLETDISIGRLRGKFHEYRAIPVLCTYHPAYLLRNPAAKKDTWNDMKLLLGRMGLEVPGAK